MKFRDNRFSLCSVSFFLLLIITQFLKQRLNTRIVFDSFLLRSIIMCLLGKVWKKNWWLIVCICFVSCFILIIIAKSPKSIVSFIRKSPKQRLERRDAFALFLFLSIICNPYIKFGVQLVTYFCCCFVFSFFLIIITKSPKRRLKTYCFCFVSSS